MAGSRTNFASAEIAVELDRESSVALHTQLEAALRGAIRSGRLEVESPLPATRRLADDLGLSRGVVVEAYQQLTAEGYLTSRPGGYTEVAVTAVATPEIRTASEPAVSAALSFHYGRPDVSTFPRAAWLRSLRRVLTEAPNERLSYSGGFGMPETREALALYLNRVRGTWTTADGVVICNGFAQGILLIGRVLAARGIRRVAVEDPSDTDARAALSSCGLEVVGVPVTADGIDVAALERSGAQAVLVTAAHQFPTGAVMSPEARAALIDWACAGSAAAERFIIEDDYDAEHRYDQAPVGALQGRAPDRVIYAGTASKTLAPGLRLGWLLAPAALVDDLAAEKYRTDRGSPAIDQLAFADFLTVGEFDRHLRRMRPLYRARRDLLVSELARRLPELEISGISAGLHVCAWLPDGLDEERVVAESAARGLGIDGLADYRIASKGRGGLVVGYGRLDDAAIRRGVAVLAEAVAAASTG